MSLSPYKSILIFPEVAAVLLEAKANVGLAKLALAEVGLEANSKLR